MEAPDQTRDPSLTEVPRTAEMPEGGGSPRAAPDSLQEQSAGTPEQFAGTPEPGASLAAAPSDPMDEGLPPEPNVPAVVSLFGAAAFIDLLRDAGLDRAVFHGFRPGPKLLTHPVIRRRIEDSLRQPGLLLLLSSRWARTRGRLFDLIEGSPDLGPDLGPDLAHQLVSLHGKPAAAWALYLHPRSGARLLLSYLAADEESLSPPCGPESSTAQPESPETVQQKTASRCETAGSRTTPVETLAEAAVETLAEAAVEAAVGTPGNARQAAIPGISGGSADDSVRYFRKEIAALQSRERESQREISGLKQRLEDARKKQVELQGRLDHAESESRSVVRQVERLRKLLEETTARAESAERSARKAQETRALKQTSLPSPAREASPRESAIKLSRRHLSEPAPSDGIVRKMMERKRFQAVIDYARAMIELDRNDRNAPEYLLEALIASGELEQAAGIHYEWAAGALAEGNHRTAVQALCQSIRIAPDSADVAWRMEKLIQTADPSSAADVEEVASLYQGLKQKSRPAAETFESMMRRLRRSLWRRLPAAQAAANRRLALEWPGPGGVETISASELATAVASGSEELVYSFRKWAAAQRGESRQQVLQMIDGANNYVPGARRVLTGATRRVLVDGSNAAWWGCAAGGTPDFENIRLVRQRLFEEGYFPVTILADAALPFQVKDAEVVHRWELRGEIALVAGRTDADESLVLEARRWDCPIVTNDLLRDVDPDGRCSRIGFTIGPGGVTLIDPARS